MKTHSFLLLVRTAGVWLLACWTGGEAFTTQPSVVSRTSAKPRAATFGRQQDDVVSSAGPSFLQATAAPVIVTPDEEQYTDFRGHKVYSAIFQGNPQKPTVVLVHGFGVSNYYWRETIQALQQEDYTVHAIDLLGQGQSAKPGRKDGIEYSINLWAEQLDQYVASQANKKKKSMDNIVLMGNSLGSLVCLAAATGDFVNNTATTTDSSPFISSRIRGLCMFNCAVGMNARAILDDYTGFQKTFFTAVFDLVDALIFGNIPLLTYVLEKVVTPELLRNALVGLYALAENPQERVDDALVNSVYQPAKDPGSPETLSQIYTNPPGKTPMEICAAHPSFLKSVPLHLVWGRQDNVTPLDGPVGRFFQQLANDDQTPLVTLETVNAGHVPFDEVPLCNESMVKWLKDSVDTSTAKTAASSKPFAPFAGFKLPFSTS